jgi:hypothetical protein
LEIDKDIGEEILFSKNIDVKPKLGKDSLTIVSISTLQTLAPNYNEVI